MFLFDFRNTFNIIHYTYRYNIVSKWEPNMSSTSSTCFYDPLWQADAHEKADGKRPCRAPGTRGPRSQSSEISRMKIFQRICGGPIVHRTETRQDGKKRQKTGGIRDHAGVAHFLSPQSKESQ